MTWVDLVALGVVLLSGVLALMRGLVREVLGVGAWVVAGVAAWAAFPFVKPWMQRQFADPSVADAVSLGGVFLIVLVIAWVVAGSLSTLVRGSSLGGLDRTLGLVFGLGRGALLLCVAYILAGLALAVEQWPAPVLEARTLPTIHRGAEWLAGQVPARYRPAVAGPRPGRPTTAAALLQSNPVGRALAARPVRE